jgi:hypothetical protein
MSHELRHRDAPPSIEVVESLQDLVNLSVLERAPLRARPLARLHEHGQERGGSHRAAEVYLHRGEILHARWADEIGAEAIYALILSGLSGFAVERGPTPLQRSIMLSWARLRLEAARLADIPPVGARPAIPAARPLPIPSEHDQTADLSDRRRVRL